MKPAYIIVKEDGSEFVTYANPNPNKSVKKRGGIIKTTNKKEAFRFATKEKAEAQIERTPKSLKDFKIQEEKSARKGFSPEVRKAVYRKTEGHCYLCGDFVDFDDFEVEHKVSLNDGGTNEISNLYCSCHKCNDIKRSYSFDEFIAQVKKIAKVYEVSHEKDI